MLDTGLALQSILQNHKLIEAKSNGNILVLKFEDDENQRGKYRATFTIYISGESSEDNIYVEMSNDNLVQDNTGKIFSELLRSADYVDDIDHEAEEYYEDESD